MKNIVSQYKTKEEMISACAWNNILHEGVQNDYESECKFIENCLVKFSSANTTMINYGIKSKAFVIKGFGIVLI